MEILYTGEEVMVNVICLDFMKIFIYIINLKKKPIFFYDYDDARYFY